ncbi:MAG: hypothetical protein GY771_14770 [bacterium]|nr:hypothetical protein [bacterium]
MFYLKTCIIAGGALTVLLIVFHFLFYKLFGWKEDFAKVSARNAKIYMTIHIALILFFVIFAVISFAYTEELARASGLAGLLTAGYALLWLWRLVWQIVYFKPSGRHLKGSLLMIHYAIILVCFLLFAVYAAPIVARLFNVY